jgi:hypothetical protein
VPRLGLPNRPSVGVQSLGVICSEDGGSAWGRLALVSCWFPVARLPPVGKITDAQHTMSVNVAIFENMTKIFNLERKYVRTCKL